MCKALAGKLSCLVIGLLLLHILYLFSYKMDGSLSKQSKQSKYIFYDGSRFLGLVWQVAEFHKMFLGSVC